MFALLPSAVADAISVDGGSWGHLMLRFDRAEGLIVVTGYSRKDGYRRPVQAPWLDEHYSRSVSATPAAAFWHRADLELAGAGEWAWQRRGGLTLDFYRERVRGFRLPHATLPTFAITVARDHGIDHFAGWMVRSDGVTRFPLEIIDDGADLLAPLADGWPVAALAESLVTVVGIGSIGSAACEGLAAYAVRHLALVDPDRLKQHNFARHGAHPRDVGRFKVNAVADVLEARDPAVQVERYPLDVVEDADVMRPLFARSDCVLVCSDGVEPRRVANHLSCRGGVPAVFACVLEDGGIGELLLVRPGVTPCLHCFREQLAAAGEIDPEPLLDRGYDADSRHLPMTAVGGDLHLVGKIAARAVVSTLLTGKGYLRERFPGTHGVVGLRPGRDREPEAPFEPDRTLEVAWHDPGQPSPNCPSCGSRG